MLRYFLPFLLIAFCCFQFLDADEASQNQTFSDNTSIDKDSPETKNTGLQDRCNPIYPYLTALSIGIIYMLILVYCWKNGRKVCQPPPDGVMPFEKDLKRLKRELASKTLEDIHCDGTDKYLGHGNFGIVYKGHVQVPKGRFVKPMDAALKVSHPSPSAAVKILEEAKNMSTMKHPNLVELLGVSVNKLRPLFAMEYLAGGSLSGYFTEQLRNDEAVPPNAVAKPVVTNRDIVNILYQVADALKYLHRRSFLHGDVAARNVLLSERNLSIAVAKLGDFGLTHYRHGGFQYRIDAAIPTQWVPPESFDSAQSTRERDAWMFGVLCWEAATLGAFPHGDRTDTEIRTCINSETDVDRGLPIPQMTHAALAKLIRDCWSLVPAQRPKFFTADSVEVGDENSVSSEETVVCDIPKRLRDLQQRLKRHPAENSELEVIEDFRRPCHCHR